MVLSAATRSALDLHPVEVAQRVGRSSQPFALGPVRPRLSEARGHHADKGLGGAVYRAERSAVPLDVEAGPRRFYASTRVTVQPRFGAPVSLRSAVTNSQARASARET